MGLFTKISITPETSGVGNVNDDLPTYSFPLAVSYTRPKISTEMEDGYKAIRNRNVTSFISATIVWRSITKAERDLLNTFYADHFGELIPFLWTPPLATQPLLFKIVGGKREEKLSPGVYNFSFTVEQLTP